jgi:hypothetical protein
MHVVEVDESNVGYAVGLGKELVSASVFGQTGPAFDWGYTLAALRHTAGNPTYFVRLSRTDDGEYTGFVGGHLSPFFFSPERMAIEDAWYVREGTPNRTVVALTLMRAFVLWATEQDAIMVQSGDIANINSVATDALYKRLGFERFGTAYKYTPNRDRSAA